MLFKIQRSAALIIENYQDRITEQLSQYLLNKPRQTRLLLVMKPDPTAAGIRKFPKTTPALRDWHVAHYFQQVPGQWHPLCSPSPFSLEDVATTAIKFKSQHDTTQRLMPSSNPSLSLLPNQCVTLWKNADCTISQWSISSNFCLEATSSSRLCPWFWISSNPCTEAKFASILYMDSHYGQHERFRPICHCLDNKPSWIESELNIEWAEPTKTKPTRY